MARPPSLACRVRRWMRGSNSSKSRDTSPAERLPQPLDVVRELAHERRGGGHDRVVAELDPVDNGWHVARNDREPRAPSECARQALDNPGSRHPRHATMVPEAAL